MEIGIAVDTRRNRIAARRLSDGARAVFDADYMREHITHGYAVTVHTAQGVTAEATHAGLGENTTRAALYVAMTRGRQSNTAYLYQRAGEASEYGGAGADGLHLIRRGSRRAAAQLLGQIIATDGRVQTAHDVAAGTSPEQLPARVARLLIDRRAQARQRLRAEYIGWLAEVRERQATGERDTAQHLGRGQDRSVDYDLDL